MPKWCAIGACNNHHLMKDDENKQLYSYYKFPCAEKDYSRRIQWANACLRVDPQTKKAWKPPDRVKGVYVCSVHFETGRPVKFEYLADQAGLSHPSSMVDYFWKWVDLIHVKLDCMLAWPCREYIYRTTPPHMKQQYRRLTSIIDCFEVFVETSGQMKAHAQMYSNYKKHTTVKFLIACSPLGAVTFLSRAYGGRISDINLVRDSGFMSPNLHQPGDQVLADRGFTMEDEFAGLLGVELVIPAFIKGRQQFSAEEVQTSRKKSSIRIHIERVIGLLKNRFDTLGGVLPIRFIKSMKDEVEENYFTSIDRLTRCCAILANLTPSCTYRPED